MKKYSLLTAALAAAALLLAGVGPATAAPIRVAGIGGNQGSEATNTVFSSGDLSGSVTRITGAQFDSMSVATLRATYDVLLFTWASPTENADWATRIQPFLALGGGVIFDGDYTNIGKLAPVVTGTAFDNVGPYTLTPVPGLTDGVTNNFVNNHFQISAMDPNFHAFISNGTGTVGVYSEAYGGRIVATGDDQDFHSIRGAGGAEGNQYTFLVDELRWVSSPAIATPEPSTLALLGMASVTFAGYAAWRRRKQAVTA
jgi:hypothetical protein